MDRGEARFDNTIIVDLREKKERNPICFATIARDLGI